MLDFNRMAIVLYAHLARRVDTAGQEWKSFDPFIDAALMSAGKDNPGKR
jgi:hypothetical protein